MDHPIIIQGAPADWTSLGDVLINNSNITNTVPRLDPFKLLSIEIANYGNWKDANTKRPVWSVSLLAAYLLAYIVQLVLLTRGILLSSRNKSGWFFRKNKDGLILPNTRFLVACSSLAFVIVQFIDTIFFLIETTGNRLHRERYSISGFQWFTLWQSALILVWGIATSLFMTAYKQGGIVGRLVGKTTTATLFNMVFIGSSICAILSQLITFSVVIAKIRKLTLLSKTTIEELDLLSAEYDPKRVQASDLDFAKRSILRLGQLTKKYFQVVKAIFYLRLTWSVLLVLISLPLGYMHIHSLLRVGAHRDRKSEEPTFTFTKLSFPSEVDQEQGVVKPFKTRSRENSVTSIKTSTSSTAGSIEAERSSVIANTILIFFHILIYILFMVGSWPGLVSPKKDLREKMEKLWDLSYVGKGLFAIVGIWSSFLFLRVSQQRYSEQHLPKKLIITARKEVFASIDTLPNQFQSYRFPEKPPLAH